MTDTTRLSKLLNKTYKNKNGNRIRQITRLIIKKYKDKPEELIPYFKNNDKLLSGIASSAYQYLIGDFKPIQELEFGGLGAIVKESPDNLKFNRKQLHYAKTSGLVLYNSVNSGNALYNSINYMRSLYYSTNSDQALQNSKNSEYVLKGSTNSDCTLKDSKNSDCALKDSTNSGKTLHNSSNSGYVLENSTNSELVLFKSWNVGSTLYNSSNSGRTLRHSMNFHNALEDSTNSDKALYKSTNFHNALEDSSNSGQTLKDSTNLGNVLKDSTNSGESLHHSTNSDKSLHHSTNSGNVLEDSSNSDLALRNSRNLDITLRNSRNSDLALSDSINSLRALYNSTNSGKALRFSTNSGYVLEDSTNSEQSLFYSENTGYVLSNSKNFNLATLFSNNSEKTFQNASFDIDFNKFSFIYNNITEETLKSKLIDSMSQLKNYRFLNQFFDNKITLDELFECSEFEATNDEFIKKLGVGAMGSTYLVYSNDSNSLKALKVGLNSQITQKEKERLYLLEHKNIVKVYGTGPVKKKGTPINAILMEYVEGQDLHDVMKQNKQGLESKLAMNYSDQLLKGIEYMVGENLEHRDLHPNNIRITSENQLKIIDFGIARIKEHNSEDIKYNRRYGGPNDIFSWALLTYKMLAGTHLISERKKDQSTQQYANLIYEKKQKMRKLNCGLYKEYINKIQANIPQELQQSLIIALENKNKYTDLELLNEVRTNFNEGLAINTVDSNILEGYRTISGNQELTHFRAYQMHKFANIDVK